MRNHVSKLVAITAVLLVSISLAYAGTPDRTAIIVKNHMNKPITCSLKRVSGGATLVSLTTAAKDLENDKAFMWPANLGDATYSCSAPGLSATPARKVYRSAMKNSEHYGDIDSGVYIECMSGSSMSCTVNIKPKPRA